MDSFRNACLTHRSLILIPGMPLVQHLLSPTAAFCARSRPLPRPKPFCLASRGSLHQQASLPPTAGTGCTAVASSSPHALPAPRVPRAGISFQFRLSEALLQYPTFYHPLQVCSQIFLINRNCLVMFKSHGCIFVQEYKVYIPLHSLPLRAPRFSSTKPVLFHSQYIAFPSQNPSAEKSWDGAPQQESPGVRESLNKRPHQ